MFDNKDFSLITSNKNKIITGEKSKQTLTCVLLTEQQFPKENGNLDRKLFCNIINDHKHSFVII